MEWSRIMAYPIPGVLVFMRVLALEALDYFIAIQI